MPRSMGSEESSSSESSRPSESSSQSSSSGVRHNCSSCRDTGYRWNDEGVLFYCTCPRGVAKEMEKIKKLLNIDMASYLPVGRVCCKVCLRVFDYSPEYPILAHTKYIIDPKENPPLVTCRACYNRLNVPVEIKPPIKKNLYSRKLRVRRR